MFQVNLLQKDCFEFFLQDLNFLKTLGALFSREFLLRIPSVGFWVTRVDRKLCWSWDASKIFLIFLRCYLLLFPIKISIDSFLLEAHCSLLNVTKFVFYVRLGVLIEAVLQNFISVDFSWYSNSTFATKTISRSSIKAWKVGNVFLNVHSMRKIQTVSPILECW